MALIETDNIPKIMKNIDDTLTFYFNHEIAGQGGSFKVRQYAQEIAALLTMKEFVEGKKPATSTATLKTGGK